MKKIIGIALCLMLLLSLSVPVLSLSVPVMDEQAIIIVAQPQSPTYSYESYAEYTVSVVGEYLRCNWYLEYEGKTYNISDTSVGMQPWEAYAGETYGAMEPIFNGYEYTYTFFFGGIGTELNGAKIYAVIDDGHVEIESQKAYITVIEECGEAPSVSVPAKMEVFQGEILDLYCSAISNDDSSLSYLWYETTTGKYEDMIAVNRGAETEDTLRVDTSYCRVTYFVCMVTTSNGGVTMSSPIEVSVIEDYDVDAIPIIETEFLEDGVIGKNYNFKLECNDETAQWQIYYNPGRANDFEKTGLTLHSDGRITGKPIKSGSFTFTVMAYNDGGEDYAEYTLIISDSTPASIEIISPPDKLEYLVGEPLDLTGLKVRITVNGYTYASSDGQDLIVVYDNFDAVGLHIIKLFYGEENSPAYDYFMVTVKDIETSEETSEESTEESIEESVEESSEETTEEITEEITEETTEEISEITQEASENTEEVSETTKEDLTSKEESKEISDDKDENSDDEKETKEGMPWWAVVLIAIACLGIGIGGTIFVMTKIKK